MALDPYMACPCGSGKKVKWCFANVEATIDRFFGMLRSGQHEACLTVVEKLHGDAAQPDCVRMYAGCLHSQALATLGKTREALTKISRITEEFPNEGYPRETAAQQALRFERPDVAIVQFLEALELYPPEATLNRARAASSCARMFLDMSWPLAAWAHASVALKGAPEFEAALEVIKEIKNDPGLPNQIRHGLALRGPDELSVFNDERRARWDDAMKLAGGNSLGRLPAAFEYLTSDDTYDKNAWYNLAVTRAWIGQNEAALEAMDHYVRLETEIEAAADAWDIAEIIRLGVAKLELSDNVLYGCMARPKDMAKLLEAVVKSEQAILVKGDESGAPIWFHYDRPIREAQASGGVLLVGQTPRLQAEGHFIRGDILLLSSRTESGLDATREFLKTHLGDQIEFSENEPGIGSPDRLDSEASMFQSPGPKPKSEDISRNIAKFWEEEWPRRPLRSLSGLSPLDAVGNEEYRRKLEGVLRHRERLGAARGYNYDFERLRGKLGLSAPPPVIGRDEPTPITAMPAAKLAELVPENLADADLLEAHRSALAADARRTAMGFAVEILRRKLTAPDFSNFDLHDLVIRESLRLRRWTDVHEHVGAAERDCEARGDGSHRAQFSEWRALLHIARRENEIALDCYQEAFDADPENLQRVLTAAENFLNANALPLARRVAEIGLQRAEQQRAGDMQRRFRDVLREASPRG